MATPDPNWRPNPQVPSASPTPDLPPWRRLSPPPALPPRVRAARLAGVLALVLVTATLLIWVLLWLAPPGPAVLVIAGAGYEDNLAVPPNAQGREAMIRLGRLAGTSSPMSWFFRRAGRLRLTRSPLEFRRATEWDEGLDDAPEQTIIVFLPMYGGTDAQGAYLLPQDASAAPADRIRLAKILDRLAQLPESKHKLLILDATGMVPNWTMGLLHDDFARGLAELDEKIASIPNLVVLSASAADQRSWPAADLRTSLFARYLFEGMLGRADANRDNRLSALEVFTYAAANVEDDARRLHGVTQTPVLLPTKGGEARARALPMTFRLDESALEGSPVYGDPLADVQASWAAYDAFRPRAAAARACAPGAWRLWEAWLTRYGQLRMSGSPYSDKVGDQARDAAQRVRQGLSLALASGSLTLEMPAVLGETQLDVPYPYGPENRLWQAAPADRRAVWQELRKSSSDGMLRRNTLFALIRRAAENPAANLDRAAELVKLLDDPVSVVRPAEAHFLVLLQRDLPIRPMPESLNLAAQKALQVRLLAERAALAVEGDGYAYAERIRPWVADAVAAADTPRQKGEDLLFGSEPAQWTQSLDFLRQADSLYQKALTDAAGLRDCLAVCDRAFAELPAYSRWVAHDLADDLLDTTLHLLDETRQLDDLVQEVVTKREAGKVEAMRKRAQAARAGLDHLQSRLDAFARTCETSKASPLRDGGVALGVPWLDGGTRSRLLVKLSRLAKQARSENEANVELSPAQLDEVSRRRAVRNGRLAMAALGPRWFDSDTGMKFADVEPFLRRPDLEGQWYKVMRWAGDEVGRRFRRYPVRVDQLVSEARKQKEVAGPLREAGRLQRRLDPGQWQVATIDAPVQARRADVEDLLVWQAERTFTDHWYNDDPATAPYYRITGLDYLRDTRRLAPFGRQEAPGAAAMRARLEAPDGLRVAAASAAAMIAGDRLLLTASLNATKGSDVAGIPVMWAVPGADLTFARLQDAGRAAVTPLGDLLAIRLTSPRLERAEQSPPLDATAEASEVLWRAYYRGQKPSQATPVALYPVAESTRNDYAPPPRAGVAVRAEPPLFTRFGEARGGLVIVVDCSGSEGPADATRSRFRAAARTFRTVLGRVPRGTRLSVWIFGQAVPPRNSVERAEETIQQIRPPAIWNGDDSDVASLAGQIDALEPWNESPIASAALRAREDLLKVEGFRDLILISDGDDNRFAKDAEANPKKEPIPAVLRRRFADTGIALHVVGFAGKDGKPEAGLIANFGFVTSRTPKGTLSTVSDLKPLLDAMRFSMPAGLRYRLAGAGKETSSGDIEVSKSYENDRWTIVTGGPEPYQLRVPLLSFDRPMTLRRGDFVLLDLDRGKFGWRRLIWSKEDAYRLRPAREVSGWRAALLQNQILGERALQMLLTLEREAVTADPGQVRPGAVWLEASPTGSKANPAVRWGRADGFPAPAWGVDVPGWPIGDQLGPPSPRLQAWWGEPPQAATLSLARPGDFDQLSELLGPRAIGEEHFTLDRAAIEEHWVEARAGVREKRWCVVIGAAHAVGKPVWAQLDGVAGLAGQEHRHFRAAGRYVGLFWFEGVNDEESLRKRAEQMTGLRLVSVTAFRAAAAAATFADLDSPAALPPRPRPVWP